MQFKIINRLSRALRIIGKASSNFEPGFFISNAKTIKDTTFNYLFRASPLFKGPVEMGVGVSNECNIRCIYCFEHSPLQVLNENKISKLSHADALMSKEVFMKLADDLSDLGNKVIRFVGRGESFVHPDFMQMCEYAIKKGQLCDITSNGTLIRLDQARSIVDIGIKNLDISIGAANPDTYHKLTGAQPDTLSKVFETIKYLRGYRDKKRLNRPRILITNVICAINYVEVVDMVRLAIANGADRLGFHRMFFCDKRRPIVSHLLLNEYQLNDLKRLLVEAALIAKRNNLETNIAFFLGLLNREEPQKALNYQRQANRIRRSGYVWADGAVYACDYPEILGNINTEDFIKIWYSSRYRYIRDNAELLSREPGSFPCMTFCRQCDKPLYKIKAK